MRPTFSVKNITASLLLTGLCHTVYATPSITGVTVTGSDGKRYTINYTQTAFSTAFSSAASQLQNMSWWGNQTLAHSLAEASASYFAGLNNTWDGPMFAWGEMDSNSINVSMSHYSGGITTFHEYPIDKNSPYYYAIGRLAPNVTQSSTNQSNNPALAAATVIDANSDLLNLFSSLNTDQQISTAASQTLPLLTGGSMQATGNALTGINNTIQGRLNGQSAGDGFVTDQYVWVKPFGSWANQNDQHGVSGFKASTTGLVVGADGKLNDKVRLGAAMAYAKVDVDSKSSVAKQSAKVDVVQLVGYGSYALGNNTELNIQADVGQNMNKGQRSITFTSTEASSEYDSLTAHVGAELGRNYQLGQQTTLTPSLRADYTWIKDAAYTETGAGLLNLNVASRSSESMVFGIDGKLSHQLNDTTSLNANVGIGYDSMAKRSSITATFAGAPGAAFTTYGLDPDPWAVRAGLGLTHTTAKGTEISVRYDAEHREGYLGQTASVKARWAF